MATPKGITSRVSNAEHMMINTCCRNALCLADAGSRRSRSSAGDEGGLLDGVPNLSSRSSLSQGVSRERGLVTSKIGIAGARGILQPVGCVGWHESMVNHAKQVQWAGFGMLRCASCSLCDAMSQGVGLCQPSTRH